MKSIRKRLAVTTILLVGAAALAVSYAYFVEPQRLVVNKTEVRIRNLDPSLSGLRIVCLSDIHGGSNGANAAKLRRIAEAVRRENADLVVMLGDYLSEDPAKPSGYAMPPGEIVQNLAGMQAKYGVYVVLGNHDTGGGADELTKDFESVGYRVLNGNLAVLDINDTKLRLLGLKDHQQIGISKLYSDDAAAMLAATEGLGDLIGLQHSPDVLPMITEASPISRDLKLMLAGHTHGGQVRLPVIGPPLVPSSYGQKYAAGQIRDFGVEMFVTTGIGTSILPFRFLVPPEIAVITIRAN